MVPEEPSDGPRRVLRAYSARVTEYTGNDTPSPHTHPRVGAPCCTTRVRRCGRATLCVRRCVLTMHCGRLSAVATRLTLEASRANALTLSRISVCTRAVRARQRVAGVRCLGLLRGYMPSRATWLRGRVRVRGAAGTARRVVEAVRGVRAPRRRVTRAYGRAVHVREPDTQRHDLGARRTKRISALRSHHASVPILIT